MSSRGPILRERPTWRPGAGSRKTPEASSVRYQRLQDIMRLAVRFQGTLGGLTLGDIEADFAVSRRTAERLRDAVDAVFGPLELVDSADTKRHWRLRSDALRRLVSLSAGELTELDTAAETLERAGFDERAAALRELDATLRATLRADTLARIESDIEALVHVEGLAMRAGPRPRLDPGAGEALPPGWLKVGTTDTPNNRGFSLRVYSPESSDGTLSVLSMTSGREKVYFPSLPMLNRYLPRCSDEIEIYRTTLCRIGLDIGKFDLKQRPWLPRHTVLNQLDDLARGVQALADCYGKRGE